MAAKKIISLDNLTQYNNKIQEQINERVKKSGDTVAGVLNVEGTLTLPNALMSPEDTEVTITDTYTSRVTANTDTNGLMVIDGDTAKVNKIQGDTVKSKNIFNRYYGTASNIGSSITEKTDKKIIVKQTVGGTYKFSAIPIENPDYYVGKTLYISAKWTASGTNAGEIRVMWRTAESWYPKTASSNTSGAVVSGVVPAKPNNAIGLYVMLYTNTEGKGAVGDTVTYTDIMVSTENVPYQPYFSGLNHAYFDSIRSTGRNLIPFPYYQMERTASGITFKANADGSVTINGTATQNVQLRLFLKANGLLDDMKVGETYTLFLKGAPNWNIYCNLIYIADGASNYSALANTESHKFKVFTMKKGTNLILDLHVHTDYTADNLTVYPMIVKGSYTLDTMPEYQSYITDIYQLSEPVQLGKWDYIDVERKKIVTATKTVIFDGSEDEEWQYMTGSYPYLYCKLDNLGYVIKDECIASRYEHNPSINVSTSGTGYRVINSTSGAEDRILVRPSTSDIDVSTWCAELQTNPLTVSYQLGTPTEEDIDIPDSYKVWNKGNETIIQGETDNSIYGAIPSITQTYNIIANPTAATNTAYVTNGLYKKLDKTGGTVYGSLDVQNELNVNSCLNVNGNITIPNSPDNPEIASVTQKYTTRETANKSATGLTIVDGSQTWLKKIEGDTIRPNNILVYPYYQTTRTVNGITFTDNGDGSIAVNGTATADALFYLVQPGVVISINSKLWAYTGNPAGAGKDTYYLEFPNYGHKYPGTMSEGTTMGIKPTYINNLRIVVKSGVTADNVIFRPMLCVEPQTEFTAGFSYLKNAYLDSIKSTGRNLFTFEGSKGYSQYITTEIVNSNEVVFTSNNQKTGSVQCWFRIPNLIVGKKYVVSLKATTKNNPVDNDPTSLNRLMVRDGLSNPTNLINLPLGDTDFEDKAVKFTFTARMANGTQIGFYATNTRATFSNYYARLYDVQIETDEQTEFTPYVEDIYKLPSPIELGKWDYIDVENKKLIKATCENFTIDGVNKKISSTVDYSDDILILLYPTGKSKDGANNVITNTIPSRTISSQTSYNEGVYNAGNGNHLYFWVRKSAYPEITDVDSANTYFESHPCEVTYCLKTPTEENIDIPDNYMVWNEGSETVNQGDIDNSIYGAELTITQTYSIHENPTEAANKAYVNNGLAKKLDKTGGTITGNLIVEGKTDTAFGAIISKKGNTTYGLAYDDEAFKLGLGSLDKDNNFTFGENEGLPIALRDDSTSFVDGELLQWNADGNKLSPTGLTVEDIKNMNKVVRLI